MNDLFMALLLVSLIGLVVGMVKPSLVKLQSRKRVLTLLGGAFVLSFILFGVTSSPSKTTDQPVATKSSNPSSSQPTPTIVKTEAQTLADVGQAATKEAVSTKASYRDTKVEKADADRPAGSKMVTMSFNVSDFFSKSSLTRDTGKIAAKAMQGIFATNPSFYDVIIWYYGETTDRYGNKKNDVIMTYAMDRVTFQKINWSNFDTSKFCDFLNQELKSTGTFDTTCNTLVNIQ